MLLPDVIIDPMEELDQLLGVPEPPFEDTRINDGAKIGELEEGGKVLDSLATDTEYFSDRIIGFVGFD